MDLVEISSIDPHDLNIYLGDCLEETGNVVLDEIRVDLFCNESNTFVDDDSDDFLLNELQDGSLFSTDFNSDDNYLEKLCLERADILQGRTSSCDYLEEMQVLEDNQPSLNEKSKELFNQTPTTLTLSQALIDNNIFSSRDRNFQLFNEVIENNNNFKSEKNKNALVDDSGGGGSHEYDTGPLKAINRVLETKCCNEYDRVSDRLMDLDENLDLVNNYCVQQEMKNQVVESNLVDTILYKVVANNENANFFVAVSKRNSIKKPGNILKDQSPLKGLLGCEKIQSKKVVIDKVQEKLILRDDCKLMTGGEKLFVMLPKKKSIEECSENSKGFRCSLCSKEFLEETALILHETIHSKRRYSTFYNCSVCDQNFTKEAEYSEHLTTHKERKSAICEVCGKQFKFQRDLTRHLLTHNGDKPFACSICEKRFTQKKSLQLHSLTHTGVKQYKCSTCDKSFSLKWNLEAHKLTHVDVKPFACNVCSASFKHKQHLNDHHQAKHDADTTFSCTECDRTFTSKQTLIKHVCRKHNNIKPFTCDVCNKQFKSKSEIAVHCRLHTGDRPYVCPKCGKRFRFQHSLKNHLLLHTNQRPFCCSLCPKTFVQKSVLDRHQTVHTKEKHYSCGHCHKKYSHRHNLTRHKMVHKHF